MDRPNFYEDQYPEDYPDNEGFTTVTYYRGKPIRTQEEIRDQAGYTQYQTQQTTYNRGPNPMAQPYRSYSSVVAQTNRAAPRNKAPSLPLPMADQPSIHPLMSLPITVQPEWRIPSWLQTRQAPRQHWQQSHRQATTRKILLPTPQTVPEVNRTQGQHKSYAATVKGTPKPNPKPNPNPTPNPASADKWNSTNPNFALLVFLINKFLSILHHTRNWTTLPRKLHWGVCHMIDMIQLPCPDKNPDSLLNKLRSRWLKDLQTTGLDHLKHTSTQIIHDLTKLNTSDFKQATEIAIAQLKTKYGSKFNMNNTLNDINELEQRLKTVTTPIVTTPTPESATKSFTPEQITTIATIHQTPVGVETLAGKRRERSSTPSPTEVAHSKLKKRNNDPDVEPSDSDSEEQVPSTVEHRKTKITTTATIHQTPVGVETLAGKRRERSSTPSPTEVAPSKLKKRNNDPDVEPSDSESEEQIPSTVERMKTKVLRNTNRSSHIVIDEIITIEDDLPVHTNTTETQQHITDSQSISNLTQPYQDSQSTVIYDQSQCTQLYNYDDRLSQCTQLYTYEPSIPTTPTQTTPSNHTTPTSNTPPTSTNTTPNHKQMIMTKTIYTLRDTPTNIIVITDQSVRYLETNPTEINLAIFNKPKPTLHDLCQALEQAYDLAIDGALPDLRAITLAVEPERFIENNKQLKTICQKFHNVTEVIILIDTADGDAPVALTQLKKTNGFFDYATHKIDKSIPKSNGIMTTLQILNNLYTSLNF